MASVQDWKDSVLAQTRDSDHIQTAEALAELLDGTSSPADIAERITSIYEPPPETRKEWFHEGQNHKVIEFWGIHMHEAMSMFGDAELQDRLIALLVEMSKQPDVKNPDGSLKGSTGGIYWKDLPDWEWQFSYYGLAYKRAEEYSPEGISRSEYLNQRPGLVNLTRFAATMLERGLFTCGLPPQASEMLHLGLEQPYEENDTNMKPFEWQVLIPVATTWLTRAGKTIYRHCLNNEVEDLEASDMVKAGWGGATWTKQRWACWKVQLQKLREREDLDGEYRNLAAQAVCTMKQIDAPYLTVQEWRSEQRAATADEDHYQAMEALTSLLEGEISANEAAKTITDVYGALIGKETRMTTDDDILKICDFWDFYMLDAIEIFGTAIAQERLASLLVEMSRQPDMKTPDGYVKEHGNGEVWWRDLPKWSYHLLEHGLDYNNLYALEHMDTYLAQAPRLLNTTKFAALLLTKGEAIFSLPWSAGFMLSMGLEQDHVVEDPEVIKGHEWRILVPAAATWLLIAGKIIYERCMMQDSGQVDEDCMQRKEWSEGIWTMERWSNWKKQLLRFSERVDFNDECRAYAAQALVSMIEVEAQHQE